MMTALSGLPGWPADTPPPAQGPEFGGSSPIGLVVTLVLLIALVFLIRSMNVHLRRVPKSFDPPPEAPSTEAEAATGGGDGSNGTGTDPGTNPEDRPNGSEVRTPPTS
jgi:hypothetical protein